MRVLEGQDEGVYGWLAVNYLKGRLHAGGQQAGPAEPSARFRDTLGVLDVGGSSLEVTYLDPDGVNGTSTAHGTPSSPPSPNPNSLRTVPLSLPSLPSLPPSLPPPPGPSFTNTSPVFGSHMLKARA